MTVFRSTSRSSWPMCDRGSRWSGTRWVAGPRAPCPTFSTTCWRRVSIRRTTSSRWPPRRRPSGGTSTAACCSRCSTCRRRNWTWRSAHCACRGCSSTGTPARGSTASATSCCGKWPTSCNRRHVVNWCTASWPTHSPRRPSVTMSSTGVWSPPTTNGPDDRARPPTLTSERHRRPGCEVPSPKREGIWTGRSSSSPRISTTTSSGTFTRSDCDSSGATWRSPRKVTPARRPRPTTSGAWS